MSLNTALIGDLTFFLYGTLLAVIVLGLFLYWLASE